MITAFASGTQTATGSGTEDFLSSPNVQGKFQLYVDLVNMAANDVIEFRAYKMVLTGGTSRVVALMTFYGAQPTDGLIAMSDWIANELTDTNAVRFSLKQTFGTGRNVPWAVLKDDALTPTTSGRTLDVTTTGAAGIDWGNVENPTTALNLSGTNIDTDQVVASVTAGVTVTTNNDKAGYRLSATGVDDVWDESMETGATARESMRLANSANGAITSGMGTTNAKLRDLADSKDRVDATVDTDGNRTAVTRDLA